MAHHNQTCGQYGDCHVDSIQDLVPVPGEGSSHMIPEHGELIAVGGVSNVDGIPVKVDIAYVETISINIGKCVGAEAAQVHTGDTAILHSRIDCEPKVPQCAESEFGEIKTAVPDTLAVDRMTADLDVNCTAEFGEPESSAGYLSCCEDSKCVAPIAVQWTSEATTAKRF